jgi:predicted lactoylglutathione lyase
MIQMTNFLNLQVNDIITFTNKIGYKVNITVSRVEEKSWYCGLGGRNSYGTLKNYMKYSDFKITKAINK